VDIDAHAAGIGIAQRAVERLLREEGELLFQLRRQLRQDVIWQ
jgi:hypothetical protein